MSWVQRLPSCRFPGDPSVDSIQGGKEVIYRYPQPPPLVETWVYRISFTQAEHYMTCPVEGTALWFQFMHFHVWDTIVVLEEGNRPLLRCP